jgi:hypothetical protein
MKPRPGDEFEIVRARRSASGAVSYTMHADDGTAFLLGGEGPDEADDEDDKSPGAPPAPYVLHGAPVRFGR